MKKEVKINFSDDAKIAFLNLEENASHSKIERSIYNSIQRSIELIKINPTYGVQIKKRMIPATYIIKYGITNLWKINLANYWRLLYTILPDGEVEILALVLDILNHREYDKRFKY